MVRRQNGTRIEDDLPEYHDTGKYPPMLDFQVWAQDMGNHTIIRHTFYQKAITSPLVFHACGACRWKPKITTLAEELGRRLVNMDPYHTEQERSDVVQDFIQKLTDSSYSHIHRRDIEVRL